MKPESFIRKFQPDPDGLDFESLRKDGLARVQELSGDLWSDYNLHDPGVTILEQLCYGLTDLAYRSSFSAADYLTSADGGIGFEQQALYRPDEILSSAPLTDNDYRKLILNSIPNIDNVWIKRQTDDWAGLCNIYVLLCEQVREQQNEGVRKAYADIVGNVYAANRNLCEDLARVRVVERIPYSLSGEIEIQGKRDPANVLAEIYFECARYLSPKFTMHSHAEMYKSGTRMEQLFSGPMTGHGYIPDEELHAWCGHFSISDILGIIGRIDGVGNVRRLVFVDADGNEMESIRLGNEHLFLSAASLKFPASDEESMLNLYKAGRAYPVALHDVETEFERLNYRHHALRQRKQRFDWVASSLPTGDFRNAHEYFSVQNHFPDIYGLSLYGVPESATPERKAQARQLKAYLLFFEQLMANFLQSIEGIPQLFSLDGQLDHSYFHQMLGNESVPDIEELYRHDPESLSAEMAGLLAGIDNYGDRRNRVLDYLMALYGERFSQNSLRHFFPAEVEPEATMIRNKLAFLGDMVEIGRSRAAAFNYRKPSTEGNCSGLERKLQILLGQQEIEAGVEPQIVEHILLRPFGESAHAGHRVTPDFYPFRITLVLPADRGGFSGSGFRKLLEETVYMNCPAHIHPQMLWLEAEPLQQFGALHEVWRAALRNGNISAVNDAAGDLIVFLRQVSGAVNG